MMGAKERQGFQSVNETDYRRKSIIARAGEKVNPGWLFRKITLFYADRKFITIAFVHLVITAVIFSKFIFPVNQ
jgi:hypothetical protein